MRFVFANWPASEPLGCLYSFEQATQVPAVAYALLSTMA